MIESFETMLTGGHPNSLGRTLEVVELILKDKSMLEELYQCYFSKDEIVRLRVSNAMKRICREHPEWLVPYLNHFLDTISKVNQPSTKWTLAQLFMLLENDMTLNQLGKAKEVLKYNLETESGWIVLNFTMEALANWAKTDEDLKSWLKPRLEKLKKDPRKSVARRGEKFYSMLYASK